MSAPLAATRAALFDLDGTLVDSLGDIRQHLNDALADAGLPTHAPDVVARWVGHGAEQLVACAVPNAELVPDVLARFRARYRARPVIDTRVFPRLDAALDVIAADRVLAVLSNKPHDLTVTITRATASRWPWAAIVGQQPDVPRKPDPTAALAILTSLDCDACDAVMIGDSEIDVATARAAGMYAVAVSWGLRHVDALRDARPDHLVHTPEELAALFA